MIFGRDETRLKETVNDVKKHGKIFGMVGDVSKGEDVKKVFTELES